jgi:hypothetical protein
MSDTMVTPLYEHFSRPTRIALFIVSAFSYSALLIGAVCSSRAVVDPLVQHVWAGAFIMSGLVSMLNLAVAIFAPETRAVRWRYFGVGLIFVPLCALSWSSSSCHARTRELWFKEVGRQSYDKMVAIIIENRSLLSATPSPLSDLVDRAGVVGRTNDDGSVTIRFAARDNNLRHGYLYHSGEILAADPFYPENPYFRQLTTEWYEY